jgi:hypothetical protein
VEPVYVSRTAREEFCAFTRKGDEIHVYLHDNFQGNYHKFDINRWLEIAPSYTHKSDIHLYDDVINAVWQEFSFHHPLIKSEVKVLKTGLGKFYPRIWRGLYVPERTFCYNPVNPRSTYGSVYVRSNISAASIYEYLEFLFKYVEPTSANMSVFGDKIRELLILTCTEIEAIWRAVLEQNSNKKKDRYTTKDYVKVKIPLHLDEWGVELRDYPELGTFRPFMSWKDTEPTRSLSWYDGYNAVKHDREIEFSRANLKNLINALAAVHILQAAQWGPEMYDRVFGNLHSPFITIQHPTFSMSDLYVPTLDSKATLASTRFFDHNS